MTKPLVALYWVNVNNRQRRQQQQHRQETPPTDFASQPQAAKAYTPQQPTPSTFQLLLSKLKRA